MTLASIFGCGVVRDRKRKKFVGSSSEEQKKSKRIKTESGQWIKASYKSDVYKKWKDKHKIEGALIGGEEGGARSLPPRHRGMGKRPRRCQPGKKGSSVRDGKEVGDLKPKNVILQKRRRKEMMAQRKKLKQKEIGQKRQNGGGKTKKRSFR